LFFNILASQIAVSGISIELRIAGAPHRYWNIAILALTPHQFAADGERGNRRIHQVGMHRTGFTDCIAGLFGNYSDPFSQCLTKFVCQAIGPLSKLRTAQVQH
jgi:hypothetical protein